MANNSYIPRYLSPTVLEISKSFPVLLVTGPRQVGKTTLLQTMMQEGIGGPRRYVSFDDLEARAEAKRDPALFLQKNPSPLFIDEVQYAPEIFSYIKLEVDRTHRAGSYWMSGSQQFSMMRNVSESLAGRVGIVSMLGLSAAEELQRPRADDPWTPETNDNPVAIGNEESILAIFERIIRGSFPRLAQKDAPPRAAFYSAYIQTYIDRDLRDLVRESSIPNFEKFLSICAARTGSLLNLSDLARDSDISVVTAKAWLGLLEMSMHVFLLRPYFPNVTKRMIKAPKLYFLDTGLACHLSGWNNPETALKGPLAGQLFETYVVAELLKSYLHRGLQPRMFYVRTKEKREVDVVMERNGILTPIEIKLGVRLTEDDVQGMTFLRKSGANVGPGTVISPVQRSYSLNREVSVLPPSVIS